MSWLISVTLLILNEKQNNKDYGFGAYVVRTPYSRSGSVYKLGGDNCNVIRLFCS